MPFITLLKEDKRQSHSETSGSKDGAIKKRSKPGSDESPKLDAHRRAEAQAAVSLAIGTLRYMGARLRGLDEGRKKDDPLRMELDKIRSKLVELKKLQATNDGKPAKSDTSTAQNKVSNDNKPAKSDTDTPIAQNDVTSNRKKRRKT
eukprot:scaffold3852_cov71-Cyclotella_meneghiniana.AAC.9